MTTAASSLKRTARSDSQRDFTITGLPVEGNHTIAASKEGFANARQTGVALASGATADIAIHLNVAAGRTKITVAGVPGQIRTDAPQLADRIAGRQLQRAHMSISFPDVDAGRLSGRKLGHGWVLRTDYVGSHTLQRQRSGVYVTKFGIHIGARITLAFGLRYNIMARTTNSGDPGATTDRP